MKKYIHILTALAILASCAKSEVNYEPSGQVTLAPVKGNVTKAARNEGELDPDQELSITAEWTHDGKTEMYILDDTFIYNDTYKAWAGKTGSYPWPMHGTLSISGYTIPTATYYPGYQSPNTDNVLFTFTDYTNDEFDLCWFGRVDGVNNRLTGDEVEVDLYHALSWITIQARGEGTPVGRWQITSLTLENATVTGDAICYYDGTNKNKAIWTAEATGDVTLSILEDAQNTQGTQTHTITDTEAILTDNIIIPQTPTDLTIGYSYQVGDQTKTDSRTVSLKLDEGNATKWESGVHYTYTLIFKSNDIQVAPSFGTWGTENQNVTVE